MDGADVTIRHGYTITYKTELLTKDREEELFNLVAYYGYLANEQEPYEDGIQRTTKTSCIKVRLLPSNHSKAETHQVTIRDFITDNLHQKLVRDCQQYYIKYRVRTNKTKVIDKVLVSA